MRHLPFSLSSRLCAVLVLLLGATNAAAYWDEFTLDMQQFSGYRPMYLLLGSPDAKIEVSLKARVLRGFDLYFGYSQLMFWELSVDSHPFRDLNYAPTFFYRWQAFDAKDRWIDIGYEHESNGLAGSTSREWEKLYLMLVDTRSLGGPFRWHASLKAWVPFKYDKESPDLARFRGLYELTMTLGNPFGSFWQGSDLTFRLFPGGASTVDPTAGGQELTLRVKPWTVPYLPLITFQLFHGYGEYLLAYNQSHWRAYVGLSF